MISFLLLFKVSGMIKFKKISPELRQALQAMAAECDRERATGKTVHLEDL